MGSEKTKARITPRFFVVSSRHEMGFFYSFKFEFADLRGFSRRSGGMMGSASASRYLRKRHEDLD